MARRRKGPRKCQTSLFLYRIDSRPLTSECLMGAYSWTCYAEAINSLSQYPLQTLIMKECKNSHILTYNVWPSDPSLPLVFLCFPLLTIPMSLLLFQTLLTSLSHTIIGFVYYRTGSARKPKHVKLSLPPSSFSGGGNEPFLLRLRPPLVLA